MDSNGKEAMDQNLEEVVEVDILVEVEVGQPLVLEELGYD
jgi:hypothetical protein